VQRGEAEAVMMVLQSVRQWAAPRETALVETGPFHKQLVVY
jgi:hypothetical protein